MQWFRRLFAPQEPPSESQRRELRELRDTVDALKSDILRLKTEWAAEELALSDLVAKMNAWVGRLAARERRKAEKQLEAEAQSQEPGELMPQAAVPRDPRSLSKAELRQLAVAQRQNGGMR